MTGEIDSAQDVETQLARIVAAVRIQSIKRFSFLDRVIDVEPPLPNRFPPLPLVNRLQAELYGTAYCTRIDGIGFGAEPPEDPPRDMLPELSSANTSQTQTDPDWLVLEHDSSGAIVVGKHGMTRRLGPGEIVTEAGAAPPGPGAVVTIIAPREMPQSGGFYFAFGETIDSSFDGRPIVRFYWNVPAPAVPALMTALTRTLNANSIPFSLKAPRITKDYRRFDAGVLFIAAPWHDAAAALLPEIHASLSSRLRPDVPLFTKRLAAGLGFAEDPGSNESFGVTRCRLLAEALWSAYVRDVTEDRAILHEIRRHWLLSGIDLSASYVNPWGLDRYNHTMFA
ncbi:MAG: T3SS effector HopA1 family protein [Rhodopila sp.]|nr:T3SS effector HopA1 family protein [Rhodopila sp.]